MSNKKVHWRNFVNEQNDFQLSTYVYLLINSVMKNSLDLGTLLSNDPKKLRAYKEQIKQNHKEAWSDIAESLESYGLIDRCICSLNEYCEICKGSRYVPSDVVNADVVVSRTTFTSTADETIQTKLLDS